MLPLRGGENDRPNFAKPVPAWADYSWVRNRINPILLHSAPGGFYRSSPVRAPQSNSKGGMVDVASEPLEWNRCDLVGLSQNLPHQFLSLPRGHQVMNSQPHGRRGELDLIPMVEVNAKSMIFFVDRISWVRIPQHEDQREIEVGFYVEFFCHDLTSGLKKDLDFLLGHFQV